jgi:glycosyltransferase involved in cell wall biosynthesis
MTSANTPRAKVTVNETEIDGVFRSPAYASQPVVSVVISTRDRAAMLVDAVQAVLSQDVQADVEVIVCDNASTDDTEQRMRELISNAPRSLAYVRLRRDLGPAGGRNIGLSLACGVFVAFTDSDCVPAPGWLRAAMAAFTDENIGMVQGRVAPTELRVPLFEHHPEVNSLDGSFTTANVTYRRAAIGLHRFDPSRWYSEDIDLGWRVLSDGWRAVYAQNALVRHRVIPLSASAWVLWPRRYASLPTIAKRFPAYRRHLFLGVWIRPIHLCFDLALAGLVLAMIQPLALLAAAPYLVAFGRTRGLRGRFPPAKAAAHVSRDLVAFIALAIASARSRALVL